MYFLDFPFGIPIRVVDPNPRQRDELVAETLKVAEEQRENVINPWSGLMDATFRFDEHVNVIEESCPALKRFVYECVNEYLDTLDLAHPYSFVKMDESWINYSKPGYYQEFHMHPEADISGVFYVTAPPNSGSIMFNSPASAYNYHKLTHRSRIMHASVTYEAFEGRLVMFPSYLEHMVQRNQSDEERISIAFNIKLIE